MNNSFPAIINITQNHYSQVYTKATFLNRIIQLAGYITLYSYFMKGKLFRKKVAYIECN